MGVVRVPTMFTWSDDDTAQRIDGAQLTEEYVDAPYRFEIIEGVSRWIPDLATNRMTNSCSTTSTRILNAEDRPPARWQDGSTRAGLAS